MDLLKAAIAEKKNAAAKRKAVKADSEEDEAPKKYVRRGEIKSLHQDNAKLEVKRASAKADNAYTRAEDKNEKEVSLDDIGKDEEDAGGSSIGSWEVKRLLRGYGQPITLFGETDRDRLQRLKQLEMDVHEKHHGSDGISNIFDDIMKQEVEKEILAAQLLADEANKDETTKAAEAAKKQEQQRKQSEKYKNFRKREEFPDAEGYVLFFLKRLLILWEEELEARPEDVKRTMKGKVASATQKQTRQYAKPLFKLLKDRKVSEDILPKLEEIVNFCMRREYVKANEQYMLLAIGNAPWPMGVTSVGIHERAGRSKIFSSQIAHVLNNDQSRKYIQSLKRLMTYCQHKYPNVPSKNVN